MTDKKIKLKALQLPEVNFLDYSDVRYLHLVTLRVQGLMLLDEPY